MALKHKASPKPLQNTSPKSKVQPKEKPMEKAGFDRVIRDSSRWYFYTIKWYVNQSATVIEFCLTPKLSLYLIMIVIGWLEIACLNVFHPGNAIIQFFPHNKKWSTVFAWSVGEGLVHGPIFAGYVLLASHNPSPILQNLVRFHS